MHASLPKSLKQEPWLIACHPIVNRLRIMVLWTLFNGTVVLAQPKIQIEEPQGEKLEISKVVAWGMNTVGQINVPIGLKGVQAIAAGYSHSVALRSDGTVVAWGSPGRIQVPAGLSDVTAVTAGAYHTLALLRDGSVVVWGDNASKMTPPTGLTGLKAIAAGTEHNVGIMRNGTIVAWGSNYYGQLAQPTGLAEVTAIASGYSHTVALKGNGTIAAWGANHSGQLNVPTYLTDVQAVAGNLALKKNGTVAAWGANFYGVTNVPRGLVGVRAVANRDHCLALKNDGTVVAWGRDVEGQTSVPLGLTGVQAIAAGGGHSLAVTGPTVDFGNQPINTAGLSKTFIVKNKGTSSLSISRLEMVSGDAVDFPMDLSGMTPTVQPNGQTQFQMQFHPTAYGLRQARLRMVSDDMEEGTFDILVTGTAHSDAEMVIYTGDSVEPAARILTNAAPVDFGNVQMGSASKSLTFTIQNTGVSHDLEGIYVATTGLNAEDYTISQPHEELVSPGASTTFRLTFAPTILGIRQATVFIATNNQPDSIFKINVSGNGVVPEIIIEQPGGNPLEAGRVVEWGANSNGSTDLPADLKGVRALAAGSSHTLALRNDGTVVSWGLGAASPVTPHIRLTDVVAIAACWDQSIALKSDGTVVTWDVLGYHQTQVPDEARDVKSVASGQHHVLALKRDGSVVAWGDNNYGQLNMPPGISGVASIAAGANHSVALRDDGTVVTWGLNNKGQTDVPADLENVAAIAAGYDNTVAIKKDGTVIVWGDGAYGQLMVPIGLTGVEEASVGAGHVVSRRKDGSITAWGQGSSGQAAIPSTINRVSAIAAGHSHNVVVTTASVAFSNQAPNTIGEAKFFKIKNKGSMELHLAGVSLLGEDATDFSLNTESLTYDLHENSGETTISVRFTPQESGPKQVTLRILSNDKDNGTFDILLLGTCGEEPLSAGVIPEQLVMLGSRIALNLDGYFHGAGGEPLAYLIDTNTRPYFASAYLSETTLHVTGLALGTAEVVVRATSRNGNAISQRIPVRTFRPPSVEERFGLTFDYRDGSKIQGIRVKNKTGLDLEGFRICVTGLQEGIVLRDSILKEGSTKACIDFHQTLKSGATLDLTIIYEAENGWTAFWPELSVTTIPNPMAIENVQNLKDRSILIKFSADLGNQYQIQYSTDLTNWMDSPTLLTAGSRQLQWIDHGAPETFVHPSKASKRYYRVKQLAP